MANVEKASVSTTPRHAEPRRDAVESGAYASGGEVIREASWPLSSSGYRSPLRNNLAADNRRYEIQISIHLSFLYV